MSDLRPDEHEEMLDMMVNAIVWLGQLGALRSAVLAQDFGLARSLAREPIRYQPWREALRANALARLEDAVGLREQRGQ